MKTKRFLLGFLPILLLFIGCNNGPGEKMADAPADSLQGSSNWKLGVQSTLR